MPFPDAHIEDRDGGNSGAETTSHTINLQSNIVAGDLLLVLFSSVNGQGGTPSGWTKDPDHDQIKLYSKTASGSEGATETITTTNATGSSHTSYRISGWNSFETAFFNGPNNTTPDPPSLSPSWGAKDTLWLACFGESNGNRQVSTYPSNYSSGRNDYWDSNDGSGVGSAIRVLNAASEDPGNFTLNANDLWDGLTIAVEPSAAPGPGPNDVAYVDEASGVSTGASVGIAKADLTGLQDGDFVVVSLAAHADRAAGWSLSGWTQVDVQNTS
jgi:hypothetical protein